MLRNNVDKQVYIYTAKRYDDLLQSPITRFTVHQFHNYVKSMLVYQMSVQDNTDQLLGWWLNTEYWMITD